MKDSTSTDRMRLTLVLHVFFYFNPLTFVSHLIPLINRAILLNNLHLLFTWLAVWEGWCEVG